LERRKAARGLPCPGCGWSGPVLCLDRFEDAHGNLLYLKDALGNVLGGEPDIPGCHLCRGEIKLVVVVHVCGEDGGATG
jgi:hypothetical protein